MKITAVETIQDPQHPALVWVQIHSDEGTSGLGETVAEGGAVARIIHDQLSGVLIGEDSSLIELLWARCYRVITYNIAGGAEMRALSAIDIALWDMLGKQAGLPIHSLFGGATRDNVPIYNTCGNYRGIRDRDRSLSDPAGLALELLQRGVTMMKIWPFDEFAVPHNGHNLSTASLAAGLKRVEDIRSAVGDDMAIAIEGHSLWDLPNAIRIARALESLNIAWIEDLMWPENHEALAQLRRATTVPIAASERLLARYAFRSLIERGGADIVMLDLVWTGGFSESLKIGHIAAASMLPVTLHNCGGPVGHMANLHYATHLENLIVLESLRAFYDGYYDEIVTVVPKPQFGALSLPTQPGLGTELREEFLARSDLIREVTTKPAGAGLALSSGDPWASETL